jgi:hypothetical protein
LGVFAGAANNFIVYYFDGAAGFTSPTWQGYPAVNMGAKTPLLSWLIDRRLPYDVNLDDDSNGDGVSLLMAYALNLDPGKNLAGSLPKPHFSAGQMSLSFYAGSAGIAYTVHSSSDMQTWNANGVIISGPDENQFRSATLEMAGPRRFLRLAVSR